ncbi:MAG: S8 family serine peptidase, partial [Clostridiales Family XIII bacterium]|nr:S8 family serine peptidase [Clostridiales Family XIII bacterium]
MKEVKVNAIKSLSQVSLSANFLIHALLKRSCLWFTVTLLFLFSPFFMVLTLSMEAQAACAPGVISVCDDQFAYKFGEFTTISYNLQRINADEAYSLGYSGKDVTVGIIDSGFSTNHRELIGRSTGDDTDAVDDFSSWEHGIHVGGIIAASWTELDDSYSKTYGSGMMGVAYEADIYTVVWNEDTTDFLTKYFKKFIDLVDIKIINNSWAEEYTIQDYFDSKGQVIESKIAKFANVMAAEIVSLLSKRDVLLIFGAGNFGYLAPATPAGLPSLAPYLSVQTEYLVNNMINAINVNVQYASNSLFYISPSSNMGSDASWYSLMAPGSNIISTTYDNYTDKDKLVLYKSISGTSMSAPYISGSAALVQQAFQGIEGKQIGDILLSTATDLALDRLPPFLIKAEAYYDANDKYTPIFKIYSYKSNAASLASLIDDFNYQANIDKYLEEFSLTNYESNLKAALDP